MDPRHTAIILIGYQNDYFSPDGVLRPVIEEASRVTATLANTVDLLERLQGTAALIIATPLQFTADYGELMNPVGILKTIMDVQAFKAGTKGAETIAEIAAFGDRITVVPGKRGLNAFSNTELDSRLAERDIRDVVIAGVATSLCVDSTARSAQERGYQVSILSDCTCGRTTVEQDFYCGNIFPLYAEVLDHDQLLDRLTTN